MKFIRDIRLILKALGIKFPPLIYLIYIGLCFILMSQGSSKHNAGLAFLIGGTVLMAIWSFVKHRNKKD